MEKKLAALTLYASGLSINKIAGLLKVSTPAVLERYFLSGNSLPLIKFLVDPFHIKVTKAKVVADFMDHDMVDKLGEGF